MDTHSIQKEGHKNLFAKVLYVALVIFLTYVLIISIGWKIATIVLVAHIVMIVTMRNFPIAVVLLPFIIAALFFSTTVPKGSFVYKKEGTTEYTLQSSFASPFIHRKPFENGPNPKGGYFTGKNLPKGWYVSVEYIISDPTKLKIRDWIILKSMVKDGVEVPKGLFDAPSSHHKIIEEYLIKEFPFLKSDVVVRYKAS